jgi:hypothetical protein
MSFRLRGDEAAGPASATRMLAHSRRSFNAEAGTRSINILMERRCGVFFMNAPVNRTRVA